MRLHSNNNKLECAKEEALFPEKWSPVKIYHIKHNTQPMYGTSTKVMRIGQLYRFASVKMSGKIQSNFIMWSIVVHTIFTEWSPGKFRIAGSLCLGLGREIHILSMFGRYFGDVIFCWCFLGSYTLKIDKPQTHYSTGILCIFSQLVLSHPPVMTLMKYFPAKVAWWPAKKIYLNVPLAKVEVFKSIPLQMTHPQLPLPWKNPNDLIMQHSTKKVN